MSDMQRAGPDFSSAGPVAYNPTETVGAGKPLSAADESKLLAVPGVVSVGLGSGPSGGEVLVVGVIDGGVAERLPKDVGGLPLVVNVTGPVDALRPR